VSYDIIVGIDPNGWFSEIYEMIFNAAGITVPIP